MRLFLIAFLLAFSCVSVCHAAEFRVRAREHFETGSLDLGGGRQSEGVRGFVSAFDLFYEQPFHYMAGLTVQRGALAQAGSSGRRVTVTYLGLEGKLFPVEELRYWFVRSAFLAGAVDPAGPGKDMWLYGGSVGTGLEFPVWKLGLAPEVGGKYLWGTRGRQLQVFYIALGVHFYVFPRDQMPVEAKP